MTGSRFELHYQPIVGVQDGSVRGVEALLRWHHPARGLVSPAEFIPLAEETGLIVKVGAWVLREACLQVRTWQQKHPVCAALDVAVNVSVQQLEHAAFPDFVARVCRETGLEPGHLTLEVTESAVMKNDEGARVALARLKSLGVKLAIDDFGTGHSSFSRLGYFDVDLLKIDRSFVGTLGERPSSLVIVRAINAAAVSLALGVVAEGVETPDQRAALAALKCETAQGYLFSKPLPAAQAEALLSQTVKPWQREPEPETAQRRPAPKRERA